MADEDITDAQLDEILARAKARRERKASPEKVEASPETVPTRDDGPQAPPPPDDGRRQMLTELAQQLLSGQWKPPEGYRPPGDGSDDKG